MFSKNYTDVICISEATPYDAEAATMYMATAVPANLLGIDDLKSHQRQSMDPNYDYKFIDPVTPCIIGSYSPPCPNGGSDITYIMRYLVNKYNWLEWADEMVSVVNGVLRVQIKLNKLVEANNFEPACSDTRVFVEIDTSLNTNMGFSKGNPKLLFFLLLLFVRF